MKTEQRGSDPAQPRFGQALEQGDLHPSGQLQPSPLSGLEPPVCIE